MIDLTCQKCDASFDVAVQALIDGSEQLVCPHCDARAPARIASSFVEALTELRAQIAALEPKFLVSVTLESPALQDLGDDDDDDDLDEDEDDDEPKH